MKKKWNTASHIIISALIIVLFSYIYAYCERPWAVPDIVKEKIAKYFPRYDIFKITHEKENGMSIYSIKLLGPDMLKGGLTKEGKFEESRIVYEMVIDDKGIIIFEQEHPLRAEDIPPAVKKSFEKRWTKSKPIPRGLMAWATKREKNKERVYIVTIFGQLKSYYYAEFNEGGKLLNERYNGD